MLAAAALIGGGAIAAVGIPAQAATPTPAVAAFNAPECVGATLLDPKKAQGEVGDLTKVFGTRLDQFNNGQVVPLYDAYGENSFNAAYPPVCGTRNVAGVGAVSEWMFCTDIWSHVCSGADKDGNLLNEDGVVIPGLDDKPLGNPKLTKDQEKLIAYLIQNGHPYKGAKATADDYYTFNGVSEAIKSKASDNRAALQVLIWCISDPVDLNRPGLSPKGIVSETDRQQTCENSMNAGEQKRLLALIPDVPTVTLAFANSGATLELGDSATFTLTTNLYNQPINLGATGLAGNLVVLSGAATLSGTTLTVTGTDPAASTTIKLGFTATAAGKVDIAASAQPASTTHIGWNQSPGVATGGKLCQIFATFNEGEQLLVSSQASALFDEKATETTPATSPGTDTDTPTTPGTDTGAPTDSATPTQTSTNSLSATATAAALTSDDAQNNLAYTGAGSATPLFLGALVLGGAGIAMVASRRKNRKHA